MRGSRSNAGRQSAPGHQILLRPTALYPPARYQQFRLFALFLGRCGGARSRMIGAENADRIGKRQGICQVFKCSFVFSASASWRDEANVRAQPIEADIFPGSENLLARANMFAHGKHAAADAHAVFS